MPKLLQINSNAVIGSTGRIVDQLGNLAIENGWVSYIAYGRNVGESKSQLIKIGNKISIGFHFLLSRAFDQHGFGSYFATKTLIRKIKEIKPDVVHLHNIHGYYLNVKLLFEYLAEANIPIIWTLHDFWSITGHCTAPVLFDCDKWQTTCNNCPCKNEYPKSITDNSKKNWIKKRTIFTLPEKMILVPVSNWLGNYISKSYMSIYPINVIHNGIEIDKFSNLPNKKIIEKYNLYNKFRILGVASGWNETNGFNKILDLSLLLPDDAIIILVGVTEEQIKILPKNIIGIRHIKDVTELSSYYALADLYINICKTHSFGLVNIESMACGTPVAVLRDSAGEEIISKDTGFLISDIKEILTIIKEVKAKGKSFYNDACMNRVKSMFNKDAKFSEYLNLYEEIHNDTYKWNKH